MNDYRSLDVQPYQLLCLICRQGRQDQGAPYPHASRLDEIQAAVCGNPIVPLTLRCNTDTVYRYQNPGRAFDTPEGETFNDLRNLTILQKLGAVPGDTQPAVDWFDRIPAAIPTCLGVCAYPAAEAPGWPRCPLAGTGNYERGLAQGLGALIHRQTPQEKEVAKKNSVAACYKAPRLKIRPHHLLCMSCFHGGLNSAELAPIQEDNLFEAIDVMQRHPEIPVELIAGPCMICPPCGAYHPATHLCIGGCGMGLRDQKKDLDTLRRLGLQYGAILPARKLLQRLYTAIHSTMEICGNGTGTQTAPEWRVCGGPTGDEKFQKARKAGLGVVGVAIS